MDKIVFAKVKDNAQIPARDSWNAGFDIYPCFDEESFIIEPHTTALVPTGIASAVPENYYIQIQIQTISLFLLLKWIFHHFRKM